MDNFIVSARKYRPQKFDDVIGQQSIAETLKKAIRNNKLASAYLFCGPRGVGKTTCARIFAKTINCQNLQADGEACNECESCKSFNEQRSVNVQELNAAANNSVDDIRAIIEQVSIPPQLGRYKVIILDEVHMLSGAASNALLKTLEEPPSYVIFILATTEKHKILPTIQSRCQIFDFNRMEINDIVDNLKMVASKENITYEEAALNAIAQKADGGMRDALSIFDQVSNFSQGNITYDSVLQCTNALDSEYYFKMIDLLVKHDVVESMLLFNDIVNKGFNGGVFMAGMASHCRDLLMSRDQATLPLLSTAENLKQRYAEQAKTCSLKFLYYAIRSFDRCSNNYKTTLNKRLSVEITLIEAAQFTDDDAIGSGRRPTRRLKPLFKQTDRLHPASAAPSTPQRVQSTARPSAVAGQPAPTPAATPQSKPASTITPISGGGRRLTLKEALAMARAANSRNRTPEPTPTQAPAPQPATPAPIIDDGPDYGNDESIDEYGDAPVTGVFYSASQVEAQWKKCCEAIKSTSVSMSQRMLGMPIESKPDHTIIVSLHNENLQREFSAFIPTIVSSMNKAFGIDDIKIETHVIPPEVIRIITNPTELLKKMRGDNPDFAQAVDELNLHLV